MEKTFKDPTKPVPKSKQQDLEVMSKDMREIYSGFYSDIEKLKTEWEFCHVQYKKSLTASFDNTATFAAKMAIRRISTYWKSRRLALEKALKPETIAKFKENSSN